MLDLTFRALADPTRRDIVQQLSSGPRSVSALAEPFALTLAAVVQHVQVLEACGLVRTSKTGRVRTCTLDPQAMRAAEQWFAGQRQIWEQRLDRLGSVLDSVLDSEGDSK